MKALIVIFCLLSTSAGAFTGVGREVEKRLTHLQTQMAPTGSRLTLYQGENETAYYLKRIRVLYAPSLSLDLFSELNVGVKPMLEFRWTRNNPKGWMNYQRGNLN